jgi:hypothetical protein
MAVAADHLVVVNAGLAKRLLNPAARMEAWPIHVPVANPKGRFLHRWRRNFQSLEAIPPALFRPEALFELDILSHVVDSGRAEDYLGLFV